MRKYLIIDINNLKRLFSEAREELSKSNHLPFTVSLSFSFSLFLTLLTTDKFKSILTLDGSMVEIIIWVLCIMSFIYSAITFLVFINNRFKNKHFDLEKFETLIFEASESKEEEILLLLLPEIKNDLFEYPVKPKQSWGGSLFLPYIPDIYNDDLLSNKEEIKKTIINEYKIQTDFDFKVLSSMDTSKSKNNPSDFPQNFKYRFILLYSKSPFFQNVLKSEFVNVGFDYKSLQTMKDDTPTNKFNFDIIDILSTKQNFIHSEIRNMYSAETKIIWNIFKKCNKGCVFCAYGEQDNLSNELNFENKKLLISSLKSLHINEIDFATGDSPDIIELSNIIVFTKQTLPCKINLTTTAEVLNSFEIDFLKKYINCVELTYDYPRDSKNEYRPENFSQLNYEKAKTLIESGIKVEALVVLNKNIDSSKLRVIKTDLLNIGISKILLLRLMPVGLQKYNSYPVDLYSKSTYLDNMGLSTIVTNKVNLHCAIQGLRETKNSCELAVYKLGISSSGIVYSCPWAEHISNESNPFIIGNILRDAIDLKELLMESKNYRMFISKSEINQPHCKIFAYLNGNNPFDKRDKLYIN